MQAIILTIFTFFSTLLGGLFAVRFRTKLHLIMGFTAGVILGVVAFDIFPEIIRLTKEFNFSETSSMIALVVGFILFHILEKSIAMHPIHDGHYPDHKHPHVGILSALALAG